MKSLVFATNNKHKLEEVHAILHDKFYVRSLAEIGCFDEIPETSPTIEGNALQKAQYIVNHFNTPCFADDTGLEVEALDGRPGVYSARYAGENATYDDNVDKLLEELKDKSNRKARFKSVVALVDEGRELLFEGIINGTIIHERRGNSGFGYDPVFVPEGYDQTFAEMPPALKNSISHRALAVEKLVNYLITDYK